MGSQLTAEHQGPDCRHPAAQVLGEDHQSLDVRLTAVAAAVPWARRVLRHMLCEWRLQSLEDTAALLVSELVANAVAVTGGPGRDDREVPMIGLTIRLAAANLVLEVWDASPARPAMRESGAVDDHGRGLVLVDALADAWGHRDAGTGKVVWCELAAQEVSACVPAVS